MRLALLLTIATAPLLSATATPAAAQGFYAGKTVALTVALLRGAATTSMRASWRVISASISPATHT